MFQSLLRLVVPHERPADETVWHRWATMLPVRMTNGEMSWGGGQLWRRKVGSRYEYQQDRETDEEWETRQW